MPCHSASGNQQLFLLFFTYQLVNNIFTASIKNYSCGRYNLLKWEIQEKPILHMQKLISFSFCDIQGSLTSVLKNLMPGQLCSVTRYAISWFHGWQFIAFVYYLFLLFFFQYSVRRSTMLDAWKSMDFVIWRYNFNVSILKLSTWNVHLFKLDTYFIAGTTQGGLVLYRIL